MTWQTDLINRYPGLFRTDPAKHAPGYPSVGDGWQLIVEKAIARVHLAVAGANAVVRIAQIKEKLGGLRIYVDWTALPPDVEAKVQEAIDLAEARASCTCEVCGASGRLYDNEGWYSTRCERHPEGQPVPASYGDADLHIQFTLVDGKMRASRCRRYDRERDAFVDTPLPPGVQWPEER